MKQEEEEEEGESGTTKDSDCGQFFDALDEFPFFDCNSNAEWLEREEEKEEEVVELRNFSSIESAERRPQEPLVILAASTSPKSRLRNGLRRRSSYGSDHERVNGEDSKDFSSDRNAVERNEILRALKDQEKEFERNDNVAGFNLGSDNKEPVRETSCVTSVKEDTGEDDRYDDDDDEGSSSFLVFLAGLVIKAVSFQVSLVVRFVTFPIWFCYCSVLFIKDPFQVSKRAREYITKKLLRMWKVFYEYFGQFLNEKLKGHEVFGNLLVKFGWGFLWSVYVCFVLFGFLVVAFVMGAYVMRLLVEEPIHMKEVLDFDYTKASPVALVPIVSCSCMSFGVNQVGNFVRSCGIPPGHKLQVTLLLTLPESEYNRKLGVFQVRVDFLSKNGEVTASSSRPCMLQFKSHLICYLETLLKSVPLLAGYSSESQVLKLKMRGFVEGYNSTWCIRVLLEQRAEYKSGAGIPEIYAASIVLESEFPLVKRVLWYWKKTIYIWISIASFMMELLLVLVCCRTVVIPKASPRPATSMVRQQDSSGNVIAQQRWTERSLQ